MNILDKIAADKRKEVQEKKDFLPLETLKVLPGFERKCLSLTEVLRKEPGVITEFKRRSPSHPDLNPEAVLETIVPAYAEAGAAGISVLTDEKYFGGSLDDLLQARELVKTPLLRKDFIIDEYQIYEAKATGADVILLIAALLTPREIQQFTKLANRLGLDILLEVHDQEELERSVTPGIGMVGVNNRNLKTFEVSLETSKRLSEKIPSDFVKVSESGISSVEAIKELQQVGFQGFLVGGNFMQTENPGKSAGEFLKKLRS